MTATEPILRITQDEAVTRGYTRLVAAIDGCGGSATVELYAERDNDPDDYVEILWPFRRSWVSPRHIQQEGYDVLYA